MKRAWTAWWLSMFLLVSLAGFSFSQGASKEEVSEPPAPKRGILEVLLKIERNIWTALQNKKLDDAFAYLDKTYTGFESEVQRRFDSPDEHYRYAVESLKDVTIDTWEIVNPKAQVYGNTVILTYLGQDSGKEENKPYEHIWKVTAVYVKGKEGWKIAHYHWSLDSEQ